MIKFYTVSLFWTLLASCLTSPVITLAQNDEKAIEQNQTEYGIEAGINFAELFGEDAILESDRKVGYSFGAYASFKITKDFKLQAEMI